MDCLVAALRPDHVGHVSASGRAVLTCADGTLGEHHAGGFWRTIWD